MSIALVGSLVVLAVLDSMSIGTFFVPVVLLLAPRTRLAPILGYLATIAVFYLAVGVLVMLVGSSLVDTLGDALSGKPAHWVQLVLGVALFALSFRFDPKRRAKKGREPTASWPDRARQAASSNRALVGLALATGRLEVATMFPYLGAIAVIGGAGLDPAADVAVLAGYCLVMVLPALVLAGVRQVLAERITSLLTKANDWFENHALGATGWILAIVGFLVARDAAYRLGFFG